MLTYNQSAVFKVEWEIYKCRTLKWCFYKHCTCKLPHSGCLQCLQNWCHVKVIDWVYYVFSFFIYIWNCIVWLYCNLCGDVCVVIISMGKISGGGHNVFLVYTSARCMNHVNAIQNGKNIKFEWNRLHGSCLTSRRMKIWDAFCLCAVW